MEPLDLSKRPPRGCREKLDGLMMLPRTIDKLRGKLPGGNVGGYIINGKVTGISGFLLQRLGVTEEQMLGVVGSAKDDDEVAAWLRAHTDASRYEKLNATIENLEPEHSEDPLYVRGVYADTLSENPDLMKLVDILDADDRRCFSA